MRNSEALVEALHEARRELPDNYSMHPLKDKGKSVYYGIHDKDLMAFDGRFKHTVFRSIGRAGWEIVDKADFRRVGKMLKAAFSAETAATRAMIGAYEPPAF